MVAGIVRCIFFALILLVLTALTQIGGIVFFLAWLVTRVFAAGWVRNSRKEYRFAARGLTRFDRAVLTVFLFIVGYAVLSIFVVPPLAAMQGRVPLPCSSTDPPVQPATRLICAFNRHYVDARMVPVLTNLARAMRRRFPETITTYLDAGFPFIDGFPLLPHLSHNDGRKLDIAYYYKDAAGKYVPGVLRSPIGYWGFEQPGPGLTCPRAAVRGCRYAGTWLHSNRCGVI